MQISSAILLRRNPNPNHDSWPLEPKINRLWHVEDTSVTDVNKDWTCKDKDKDQAYKDQDKDNN